MQAPEAFVDLELRHRVGHGSGIHDVGRIGELQVDQLGDQFASLAAIDLVLEQVARQCAGLNGEAARFADDDSILLVVLEQIGGVLRRRRNVAIGIGRHNWPSEGVVDDVPAAAR